jgi:hypothetical protein
MRCTALHLHLCQFDTDAVRLVPAGRCLLPDFAEDTYRLYREALRRRVCAVCLDGADNGSCALAASVSCAIEGHLPQLIEAVRDVREGRAEGHASAIESRVCGRCPQREPGGRCAMRQDGSCAIAAYLPLIVEAIEQADRQRASGGA